MQDDAPVHFSRRISDGNVATAWLYAYMKITMVDREKNMYFECIHLTRIYEQLCILGCGTRYMRTFAEISYLSTSIYRIIKLLALFTPTNPLQAFSNARPALILTSNAVYKFCLKSYHIIDTTERANNDLFNIYV